MVGWPIKRSLANRLVIRTNIDPETPIKKIHIELFEISKFITR